MVPTQPNDRSDSTECYQCSVCVIERVLTLLMCAASRHWSCKRSPWHCVRFQHQSELHDALWLAVSLHTLVVVISSTVLCWHWMMVHASDVLYCWRFMLVTCCTVVFSELFFSAFDTVTGRPWCSHADRFCPWYSGATYIRKGGHHVGHWPTFLVCVYFVL